MLRKLVYGALLAGAITGGYLLGTRGHQPSALEEATKDMFQCRYAIIVEGVQKGRERYFIFDEEKGEIKPIVGDFELGDKNDRLKGLMRSYGKGFQRMGSDIADKVGGYFKE